MKTIYAVPIEAHDACGIDVGAICWGSCGKGSIGGIGLDDMGSGIPCVHPPAECPHHAKDSGPFGTIEDGGEETTIVLRRLRAPSAEAAPTNEAKETR
jgi:hypothetical protein